MVDWNLGNTFKSEAKSGSPCKDVGWTMLQGFSSESDLFVLNLELLLAGLKLNLYIIWINEYMYYFFLGICLANKCYKHFFLILSLYIYSVFSMESTLHIPSILFSFFSTTTLSLHKGDT